METGVNQLGFISSYSPIGDDERGHYSAKPEYYGMLAFSVAGRGELLQTEVDPTTTEIKAYATRSKDSALTITLINKGSTGAILRLDTKSSSRQASLIRLEGPCGGCEDAGNIGWRRDHSGRHLEGFEKRSAISEQWTAFDSARREQRSDT